MAAAVALVLAAFGAIETLTPVYAGWDQPRGVVIGMVGGQADQALELACGHRMTEMPALDPVTTQGAQHLEAGQVLDAVSSSVSACSLTTASSRNWRKAKAKRTAHPASVQSARIQATTFVDDPGERASTVTAANEAKVTTANDRAGGTFLGGGTLWVAAPTAIMARPISHRLSSQVPTR